MHSLVEMALGNAVVATALAAIVFAMARLIRTPAWTHCLWLLVLLKLVTPPVIPVRVPASWLPRLAAHGGEAEDRHVVSDPPGSKAGAEAIAGSFRATSGRLPAVERVLLWVWAGGTALIALAVVARICQFRRALRWAMVGPGFLQQEAASLARRLGVARCPRVRLLDARMSPMLWALTGEASVLFPFGLLERLSPEARRTLLLHELAHLRRGDHWVRLVEAAVTALYWWHPVVWWARREIRIAEEACCDGWVLSEMPDRRETYASALVEAACFSSESPAGLPVAASGLGSFASVKRRVTMIMLGDDPEKLSPVGRFALIAAALLCLMLLPTRAGMEDGPRQPPSGVMAAADVSFQRFDPQVELQAFEASARQARGR